jgi:hypothetical protein
MSGSCKSSDAVMRKEISHFIHYSFDPITLPPSSVIVAPLTYAPALLLKKRQVPATSSGVPILPSGMLASIADWNFSNVAFIILDWNGPQAIVLDLRVVSSLQGVDSRKLLT